MTMVGGVPSLLLNARAEGYAVCAFNVFDETSMAAVLGAASEVEAPVIVQTSAIVARRLGPGLIKAMFQELAGSRRPTAALQLDHCSDLGLVSACLEARWDAVLFDGSAMETVDNMRVTAEVVAEAHRCGVAVEGELESIRGVEAGVRSVVRPPSSIEAMIAFIEATGIDAFAPSIGNVHGRATGPPSIDIALTRDLAAVSPVPLVLHGGSGIDEAVLRELIQVGIAKVNVSTDILDAYSAAVMRSAVGRVRVDPIEIHTAVGEAIGAVASGQIRRACGVGPPMTAA